MNSSTPSSGYPRPTRALLSVRPQYADAILRGEKRYEYRRVIFARPVDTILIYATSPRARVVGEFDVQGIMARSPRELWECTRDASGIDELAFFHYFAGKALGYAIEVGEVRRYEEPFCPLSVLKLRPPQSFAYVRSTPNTAIGRAL
jgi:predicted transcriptional regulator